MGVFGVPKVEAEYKDPHSQDRHYIGKLPQMWGQSLYVLCQLLREVHHSSHLHLRFPSWESSLYDIISVFSHKDIKSNVF